jgi:hypothetical protein
MTAACVVLPAPAPPVKPPLRSVIIPGCIRNESGATAPNTIEAPTFEMPVKKGLNRLLITKACIVGPDAALAPPKTLSSIPPTTRRACRCHTVSNFDEPIWQVLHMLTQSCQNCRGSRQRSLDSPVPVCKFKQNGILKRLKLEV